MQERRSFETLSPREVVTGPVQEADAQGEEEPATGPAEGPRRGLATLFIALAAATTVVVADQVTKSLAESRLEAGPVHVLGPLYFNLQYNTGSAFSLLTGWAPLLVVVALVLVGVLAVLAWRTRRPGVALALGLVLGGALGNLTDRLVRSHHGAVVDFIDFRFWPTFNLADASIVIGLVLLAIQLLRSGRGAH